MAREEDWTIKTAQDVTAPDVAPEEEEATDLPEDFVQKLSLIIPINHAAYQLIPNDPKYAQFANDASTSDAFWLLVNTQRNALLVAPFPPPQRNVFNKFISALAAGKKCDPTTPDASDAIGKEVGDIQTLIAGLKDTEENIKKALTDLQTQVLTNAKTYMNGITTSAPFISGITALKKQQDVAIQTPRPQIGTRAPAKGLAGKERTIKTAQGSGPLSSGRYESLSQLRDDLIAMGPSPETYEKIMSLVGQENEDSAKDALSSFYQGLAAALCMLYDMLVEVGMANPVDAEIVENLMAQHPELSQTKHEEDTHAPAQASGLFIPTVENAAENKPEALTKTAQSVYPVYFSHGAGENKYCPKIRKTVSCFICRNHCLDGLIVDDGEVLCAEAIWRQAVADKFSREYRDAKGNWVGGYINKRFEIHRDDGGHPALIVPGARMHPMHEDAWSLEKRLSEMKASEAKKRGYNSSPDPKDLYNFDQYELLGGPDNRNFGKKKDPLSKTAKLEVSESMFKTAQGGLSSFDTQLQAEDLPVEHEPTEEDMYMQEKEPELPEEGDITTEDHENWFQYGKLYYTGNETGLKAKMEEDQFFPNVWFISAHGNAHLITLDKNPWRISEAKKYKKVVPEEKFKKCKEKVLENSPDLPENAEYGICTKSLGGQPASYHKKKKEEASTDAMTKEAWGLNMTDDGGGHAIDTMGTAKKSDPGPHARQCKRCHGLCKDDAKECQNCGSKELIPCNQTDIQGATGAIANPDIKAVLDADIRIANGVYRASKNGSATYGSTTKEALDKLAQALRQRMLNREFETSKPENIAKESSDMIEMRQEDPSLSQPPLGMEPREQILPPPVIEVPSTTKEIPVERTSPVPSEVGPSADGMRESEFFTDEDVETAAEREAAKEIEEAFARKEQLPISGKELSWSLQKDNEGLPEEEKRAIETDATIAGAGPD